MSDIVKRVEFWIALVIVLAIKLTSSSETTPRQKVLTVFIAIGSAVLFTDSVVHYLKLDASVYEVLVSAIIALTAEHLARQVLGTSLTDIIRAIRGTTKK